MGNATWRVLSLSATLLATKAATSVASRGWKVMTGRPVPIKGDFEREKTSDVVAYAALSSMLVVAARVAAERKAAEYYRRSTGHLPSATAMADVTHNDLRFHRRVMRARRKAAKSARKLTS